MQTLKTLLLRIKADAHIPIALLVFSVTSVYHFWTGTDLGPQYVNSIYALYAFLGGHALVQGKWGDSTQNGNQ